MDLGPSSNFKLNQPEPDKPSMFSVLYGSLRAKVTKATTGDTKLMIKSGSTVMGVRGTDFQTTFNSTTAMTSMVTFEGAVAMAKIDPGARPNSAQLLSDLRNPDKTMLVGTRAVFGFVADAAVSDRTREDFAGAACFNEGFDVWQSNTWRSRTRG